MTQAASALSNLALDTVDDLILGAWDTRVLVET